MKRTITIIKAATISVIMSLGMPTAAQTEQIVGEIYGGDFTLTNKNFRFLLSQKSFGLPTAFYFVDVYRVSGRVYFEIPYVTPPQIIFRADDSKTMSNDSPNDGQPFASFSNITTTYFEYRYYAHYVRTNVQGININKWIPVDTTHLKLAYIVDGTPVTTLKGSDKICGKGVYELKNNFNPNTNWFVTSGFSLSNPTMTSVTVTPTALNGQVGVVTALVGDKVLSQAITACSVSIVGDSNICSSRTFSLSDPSVKALWSVSSGFFCSDYTLSNQATVHAPRNRISGKLTANIEGCVITKAILACDDPSYPGSPYCISDDCISCGLCQNECPVAAIFEGDGKYMIDREVCTECGACVSMCPLQAIITCEENLRKTKSTSTLSCERTKRGLEVDQSQANKFKPCENKVNGICSKTNAKCTKNTTPDISVVYTNPVSNILIVNILVNSNAHIMYDVRLLDAQANVRLEKQTYGGKIELNVSQLPQGIYYLHITNGKELRKEQIFIRRE